jgi:protein-L-isoaspartate(D-aspartate) O-methyltransferase
MSIPLGNGQFMWEPKMEARVLQSLVLKRGDRVLEVGTGSGYLTALLASLAQQVVSVEIDPALKDEAERKLKAHGLENVVLRLGDAATAWEGEGNFDVIVLTGSTPVLPEGLLKRLIPGGRLFAFVGEGPAMRATMVHAAGPDAYRPFVLFESNVKPLANAARAESFVF